MSEEEAELERLYTDYFHAVGHAYKALHGHGMNSELFREKDAKIGALRRRIREVLGRATKWDEWE